MVLLRAPSLVTQVISMGRLLLFRRIVIDILSAACLQPAEEVQEEGFRGVEMTTTLHSSRAVLDRCSPLHSAQMQTSHLRGLAREVNLGHLVARELQDMATQTCQLEGSVVEVD